MGDLFGGFFEEEEEGRKWGGQMKERSILIAESKFCGKLWLGFFRKE